jgi:hypothetical protein
MMAQNSCGQNISDTTHTVHERLQCIMDNTSRIARLKLLFIAAKVVYHSIDKVKYYIQDSRTPVLMQLLEFLDETRYKGRRWVEGNLWHCRFSLNIM